ncbi:hypothetical protein HZH68_001608 [Vespula germanica]|uniref:Uncharacterized protein n=1 Tax=Vespula germanica TaxID=30212 RepID=A0A834NVX5_VESGE|nr:hypothetical protein HZH68_001608 [Vespula germanica]
MRTRLFDDRKIEDSSKGEDRERRTMPTETMTVTVTATATATVKAKATATATATSRRIKSPVDSDTLVLHPLPLALRHNSRTCVSCDRGGFTADSVRAL